MNYSTDEIISMVTHARQQQSFDLEAREVIDLARREKHVNIKTYKHISREEDREESDRSSPSDPIGPASQEVSPEGLRGLQESVITPCDNVSSRAYSGIEAYHVKTDRGIKLNLTLQTPADAELGVAVKLTGELKRQKRWREIRPYAGDAEYFQSFVQEIKDQLQTERPDGYEWCLGRVHMRGKRNAWFANVVVLASIQHNKITQAKICIEDDIYELDLDLDLNENQMQYYSAGGRYGAIRSAKTVPTLATATRVLYK
jgi:hypothetical protein